MKSFVSLFLAVAMLLGLVPAVGTGAKAAEDKLNLSAANTAYCAACEKTVTWTALSGNKTAAVWLVDGGHYYLSNHLSSSGADGAITVNTTTGNAACLHLNGYNITSTAGCTVTYAKSNPGTLNILGSGTVSGSGVVAASNWKAATLNVTNGAILNLYGGTYTKGASDAPVLWVWKGQAHMYEGVTVRGTNADLGNYSSAVIVQNADAAFFMHGGEITGGATKSSGGNVSITNGSFTMSGGTIHDGDAVGYHGGNVYLKAGSFTMTGGSIYGGSATYYGSNVYINPNTTATVSGGSFTEGIFYVAGAGTTTLSGAPEISELKLPAGVTVTAGKLTAGASIAVNTTGVFTTTGASAALGSFRAANATDSIVAKADGTLAYFSNAKLAPDASGNAVCPACDKSVKWQAVSGTLTSTKWLQADTHYYLTGNVTYAGTDQAFYSPTGSVAKTACLHLNGYNITASAGKAIQCGDGTLNIMGNGRVSGNGAVYGGATIHTWGSGKLNLYGGTYTKGNSQYPVLFSNACTVNLYSGMTVDGIGTTPSGYAMVYAENSGAVVNMYGGTVQNGTSTGSCGGVRFANGIFHMYGGTIRNCVGSLGGNIYMHGKGKAQLCGGTVEKGSVYAAVSEAVTLSGAPKIDALKTAQDVNIKLEALTQGTKIVISDTCGTTADNATLQAYVDAGYFVTDLEGKQVVAEGSKLVIADIPAEEPETPKDAAPVYITGDVLYETDFEGETVGQLPAGWSAGYSEGSAENGTKTTFGWGSGGTMTAKVEEFGSYGKVFRFNSGNNDAFAAMGQIPTTNYLYEATVYVDRGYGSFGLANNYYGPTTTATGALFSSIYPKGDSAKYTYKGAGRSGSQLWTTSYSPAAGTIVDLQILSLNGMNYIYYNGHLVAQCPARLEGQGVDHPGFYTCYGGIYVLGVTVTEVFAADITVASATVVADPVTLKFEFDFDKDQGIYQQLQNGDVTYGALLLKGIDPVGDLTHETSGVSVEAVSLQSETENLLRFACSETVAAGDYEKWYTVRPFVQLEDVCFYGENASFMPAKLANGAYKSADPAHKAAIVAAFGSCSEFTAVENQQVSFTLFSDFHYKPGMYPATVSDLKTILQRADDNNADFIMSAGDFSNDLKGSPELYNTYRQFTTAEGKILPAYNVYGNHELEFGNSMDTVTWTLTNDAYTDHAVVWGTADGSFDSSIGYYYFETRGFRIIGLDSEYSFNPSTGQYEHNRPGSSSAPSGNTKGGSLGPEQINWLEDVLMDAAGKKIPCIIVAHDGFGPDWCDTSPDTDAVQALYRKANQQTPGTVLMSINGHIHTDHQGWLDGVFYLDTNTVRNNWWQETAVAHYGDEHTFLYEEYDDEGNLVATYPKKYNELTMGAKTWFSEDPISCNVTVCADGSITIDGVKSRWAYGIVPEAAATVDGVECEITSGAHWNCDEKGHLLQLVSQGKQAWYACSNNGCAYMSAAFAHQGIVLEYEDGSTSVPEDADAAVAAHLNAPGSVLRLTVDGLEIKIPEGKTVTVDFGGKLAYVSGSGTLCGMDSSNDAYELSAGGAIVAPGVTVQTDVTAGRNGNRYIALTLEGKTSFHRLNVTATAVTLRTSAAGLYYKGKYDCDSVLAGQVATYGIVMSIHNMPGADFQTQQEEEDNNCYTVAAAPFAGGVIASSGSVFGIMKEGNPAETNDLRGRLKIYANPYIRLNDGTILVADNRNVGKTAENATFDGCAFSLYDTMVKINDIFNRYAPQQQEQLRSFYAYWKNRGMNWNLNNLD